MTADKSIKRYGFLYLLSISNGMGAPHTAALLKSGLALSFFFFVCNNAPAGVPPPQYKIITASERGTYIVLGRDLVIQIAPDAGFELESLPSAGSADKVRRLRFDPRV
jgi:TRAP-type uncharacterized transport system substrate-binding protein